MDISLFRQEMQQELAAILKYWMQHTVDEERGGFYGRIDNNNTVYADAPKGCVLNARILWTFSAAASLTNDWGYAKMANRAFAYIRDHFVDHEYGGVYWSVTSKGELLDAEKQVYAMAFVLYACSEYYIALHSEPAKQLAIDLYRLLQQKSFDPVQGGYFEAFARNWEPIQDSRLSNKGANAKKTMNSHLHILEAYTCLYRIWPDAQLKQQIKGLLVNFDEHILDHNTGHLLLFFDERWQLKGEKTISYGHDIEASWLLLEAAKVIADDALITRMKALAIKMAEAVIIGLDVDGGLWYEYDTAHNRLIREKHWWPQAETLVGFYNAWQLSDRHEFLQYTYNNWAFIKQYIRDNKNGEWFWGVYEDHSVMPSQDKVGLWKCPYHNGRACMEIIKRIGNREDTK
jgi:mannobiose 2-epimerase